MLSSKKRRKIEEKRKKMAKKIDYTKEILRISLQISLVDCIDLFLEIKSGRCCTTW